MLMDSGQTAAEDPPADDWHRAYLADDPTVDGEADLAWLLDDPYLGLPRSAWNERRPSPGRTDGQYAFGHHVLSQLHARLETERITAGLPASPDSWERHLEPQPFDGAGRPPFRMRPGARDDDGFGGSPDVRLVLEKELPPNASGRELDTWAWQTFGTRWDAPGPATDRIRTRFEDRMIPRTGGAPRFVRHLNHQPFAQVFRIESRATSPRLVTFRVFLALADHAEDPTLWMRLDTFQRELEPGPNVVIRPARRSSMLRRDARGLGESPPRPPTPEDRPGWPYHLLLPRGSAKGTRFRLLVLLTEDGGTPSPGPRGAWDGLGGGPRDVRPPAFPFCHPFPDGICATFAGLDHAAMRDVTIQHCASGIWPNDGR